MNSAPFSVGGIAARPNPLQSDLETVVTLVGDTWEDLRNKRIFVTGGTGFFGCWILESFCFANRNLGLNSEIVVLTRDPDAFRKKAPHLAADASVSLHSGDVRDFTFPSGEFQYVIHAATEARAKQASEAPLKMLSTIVQGTERVLKFSTLCGATRFLLTSSGAVYGPQPPELSHVIEDFRGAPDPLSPSSVYAEGKRTAELLCALYQRVHGLDCKIARCWAFCGPYLPLNEHFAIGNFIRDALEGRAIQISGDGTPRRSYLYASDLVVWLWTILLRAPHLLPINVGSDRDLSILELARTVAAVVNPGLEIRVAHEAVPGALASRYVPAVHRAWNLLKLRETVTLEESIRRTALWYSHA